MYTHWKNDENNFFPILDSIRPKNWWNLFFVKNFNFFDVLLNKKKKQNFRNFIWEYNIGKITIDTIKESIYKDMDLASVKNEPSKNHDFIRVLIILIWREKKT